MQLVSLRLRYYSDKLKLNQIMHWLGAIGIAGTQILLRQTRVDSDFTQIIWVKICWLGPLAVQLRQTFYECLIFYQNMILKKELRKQVLHHIRWISLTIILDYLMYLARITFPIELLLSLTYYLPLCTRPLTRDWVVLPPLPHPPDVDSSPET